MIQHDYIERVYAGFIGMNAGIRLGAPVEPIEWTPEMIQDVYGEISGYIKNHRTFSADDDANGPVFFIRALIDDAVNRALEPQDVANAWLNYSREGIGMFWWGGEGVSTEHTAYLNLKKGIPAPQSGSSKTNGIELAEQIGGQIFIDTWGWLFPNRPAKAADYAEIAASVSHDHNGLYGARFMAACIASAFKTATIEKIIEEGLNHIPENCLYAAIVKDVIGFHKRYPDDFWECRDYLELNWGYNRYPGICHIIPNAGVCILALLYGEGDFNRTIEIATMCGWDTDCNAGNVGSILGTFVGLDGISNKYRKPINDCIVTSSVSGYLNILDIPTFVKSLALLGYRLAQEQAPLDLQDSYKEEDIYFDFRLPGSTHGFRTSNPFKTILKHNAKMGYQHPGSLEIFIDRMSEGDLSAIYYKSLYRREDFNDEKYMPTFSPTAYSGQTVSMKIYSEPFRGKIIQLIPYIRNTHSKELIKVEPIYLRHHEWQTITFTIPNTNGALIDEVGFIIASPSSTSYRAFGKIFLDEFHITGSPNYSIDFSKQCVEFSSVLPFAHHLGEWSLKEREMHVQSETDCASFSGHYYLKDARISAVITPHEGEHHGLIFRAQGIKRYYQVGFNGQQISLYVQDFGLKLLKQVPFEWNKGESYQFEVRCKGHKIEFLLNHENILSHDDDRFSHGMFGFYVRQNGICSYKDIEVKPFF